MVHDVLTGRTETTTEIYTKRGRDADYRVRITEGREFEIRKR